ncbi:MAG: sugar-binding domain-containing protein, partial [Pyrinomonadaceae bacterium]
MTDSKLNRRNFLKTTAVGAASISMLANTATTAAEPLPLPASFSKRHIIPLNHKWLYSEKSSLAAMQPAFNDKAWTKVTIPHTNKMLPVNGFDEAEYTFVSAYRRHFRLPAELKGHRIFVDFGGVMTAAKVFINGKSLGEYKGGYTPFSFELTNNISWTGDNVLAVEVDSTERKDIPPFGNLVDYLTFGGIYRDVNLRAVNDTYIGNVFAKPIDVLKPNRRLSVKLSLEGSLFAERRENAFEAHVEMLDGSTLLAQQKKMVLYQTKEIGSRVEDFTLENLGSIALWDLKSPKLYTVRVTLSQNGKTLDHYETRIGFREAKFTPEGFYLNGKHVKLRGLNRHQTYPYVGQAMPERGQRKDAEIIK